MDEGVGDGAQPIVGGTLVGIDQGLVGGVCWLLKHTCEQEEGAARQTSRRSLRFVGLGLWLFDGLADCCDLGCGHESLKAFPLLLLGHEANHLFEGLEGGDFALRQLREQFRDP